MLGVEGVEQRLRTSAATRRASSSAVSLDAEVLVGPGGQVARARPGRCGAVGLSRLSAGRIGGVEPPIELVGERGALVMLVGEVEQERLDLGPELGPELLGVDERVEPLGRPGGQALAVVAGGLACGRARRGTGSCRPGPGARPPCGRRAARASAWICADDLGPVEARPVGRVDGEAELVVDPAGERAAAPVVLEELAGRRQVDLLDRRARPSRAGTPRGRRGRTRTRRRRAWRTCLRSLSLRFSSYRALAQSTSACQVQSAGSASEGRFSSIASRIGVGELALGLVRGRSRSASSNAAPLKSRGVSARRRAAGRPTRRSWPRRSRRRGTGRRRR